MQEILTISVSQFRICLNEPMATLLVSGNEHNIACNQNQQHGSHPHRRRGADNIPAMPVFI
jgi:hypothetical protein